MNHKPNTIMQTLCDDLDELTKVDTDMATKVREQVGEYLHTVQETVRSRIAAENVKKQVEAIRHVEDVKRFTRWNDKTDFRR